MRSAPKWVSSGLLWCGVLIAVAVSLPLLALVLVVFRVALLVVAIVAMVTSIALYGLWPAFRHCLKRAFGGSPLQGIATTRAVPRWRH